MIDSDGVKTLAFGDFFTKGSFLSAHLGRNDEVMQLSLGSKNGPLQRILIVGPGPYELWTTAGQPLICGTECAIIGLERDEGVHDLNMRIKNVGSVSVEEVQAVVGDPIFIDKTLEPFLRHRGMMTLNTLNVCGVVLDEKELRVEEKNCHNVQLEHPENVLSYITRQDSRFDLIFAGNVENNLIFQEGYSYERAVNFHKDIIRALCPQGLYAFTTNDFFMHSTEKESPMNTFAVLEESGMEVLYKANQFAYVLERGGARYILENCGVISSPQGKYDTFKTVGSLSRSMARCEQYLLSRRLPAQTYTGAYSEFKTMIDQGNHTNVAFIKLGINRYRWLNIKGEYATVFETLGSESYGFYPNLFAAAI